MIDGTAIKEVERIAHEAQSAAPRTIHIDGIDYSTTPLHEVRRADPAPKPLQVTTLTGLSDYLRENRDGLGVGALSVLVESPTSVALVGPLTGRHQQRFRYVEASPVGAATFPFGQYQTLESAVIQLRSQFTGDGDRDYLLAILGTVVSESGVQREDDGVSQTVTAKAGARLVTNHTLKPTVVLAPFRTFTEVAQPGSEFVLRLRDQGGAVQVALFEADGGAWRREAIHRVQRWLRHELGGNEGSPTADVPVIA